MQKGSWRDRARKLWSFCNNFVGHWYYVITTVPQSWEAIFNGFAMVYKNGMIREFVEVELSCATFTVIVELQEIPTML